MVDFNNEATVSRPATELVKTIIIQRRYDLFEQFENYTKRKTEPEDTQNLPLVKARLFTLYLELHPMIKRKKDKEYITKIGKLMKSDKEEDIVEAIYYINDFIDLLKITKIDTRREYDSTRVEIENSEKSL